MSLISFFRYSQIFVAPECVVKRTPRSSSFFLIPKRGKRRKEVYGEMFGVHASGRGGGKGVLVVLSGQEVEKKLGGGKKFAS
jgi:hypothetical protein